MRRLCTRGGPRTLSIVIGQGLAADQLSKVKKLLESNPQVPACVEYRLVGHQGNAAGQVFKCLLCVYQGNVLAAEIETEYRVIPEVFSEKY